MKRYCFALDLIDDTASIEAYERWHQPGQVWPEIIAGILESGIVHMEIYRTGNRLFMIMETTSDFSFDRKATLDKDNRKVLEWENMMDAFQQRLPWAKANEKWVLMKPLFQL